MNVTFKNKIRKLNYTHAILMPGAAITIRENTTWPIPFAAANYMR